MRTLYQKIIRRKNRLVTVAVAAIIIMQFAMPRARAAIDDESGLPIFSTDLVDEPHRPRGYVLAPIVSFILPGFDQWWEGQYAAAGFYTATAVAGIVVDDIGINATPKSLTDASSTTVRDDGARTAQLGSQMIMAAGSFSAFSSFRSAVKSRRSVAQGSRKKHLNLEPEEFKFLKTDETVGDILLAPFDFRLMQKPTTFIPILIALGTAVAEVSGNGNAFINNSYRWSDAAFAGGFSYLAGTNEEALFRGFFMPVLMQWWDSPFWSNMTQALVFSAAHISSDNPVPWPQFLLGGYLGYISQRNAWSLKENVFIHAWWDAIVFTSTYLYNSQNGVQPSTIYLPTMTFTY